MFPSLACEWATEIGLTYYSANVIFLVQKVALDCLSYHATANDEDAIWLSKETIPKVHTIDII
jgi:hypothetical protein